MRLKDWYRETERPEERELRRKLRRKARLESAFGWIGLAVLIPLSILLFWLYLVATPDWPIADRSSNLDETSAETIAMETMP